MTSPHRINLSRAWIPLTDPPLHRENNQDLLLGSTIDAPAKALKLQRFFQKPTNLCQQTQVRLRIDCQTELRIAVLNGQELFGFSRPLQPNANPMDTENFQEFRYDWDVTSALETRNQLVLGWPIPDLNPPESPPKFQVWLEIFAP